MIRRLILGVLLALAATAAFAQYPVTIYSYYSVAGVDYARNAYYMNVKLCHVETGACTSGNTGGFGSVRLSARAGMHYAYIWSTNWGSSTQPDPDTYEVFPIYSPQGIGLSAFPRPYAPNLVSPCNYCQVGQGDFDLVWTNGLDADRKSPNWPVTYEIWTSSTPVGWPQGQEWLAVPDAPCNPDAKGNCHWYVDHLVYEPGAKYTWRIVVKINFGGGIIYKTSGPKWNLQQRY
jgi:hypothetical protein